jgi:uncharacterized protein
MNKQQGKHIISPSDLANHHACQHVTRLELERLDGRIPSPPDYKDEFLEMLQERGRTFEKEVLQQFILEGLSVVAIGDHDVEGVVIVTSIEEALNLDPDIIYQAKLEIERNSNGDIIYKGIADFLKKIGPKQYEVIDTKLSSETKIGAVLQVALYSDMIAEYTGHNPEKLHILKPEKELDSYRLDRIEGYYLNILDDIEQTISDYKDAATSAAMDSAIYTEVPDPVDHCHLCRYRMKCESERKQAKHLSLIAGMTKNYRERFRSMDSTNMDHIVDLPTDFTPELPTSEHIIKGYRTLVKQAKLQRKTEENEANLNLEIAMEYLPVEELKGLNALPEPHEKDLYLDFEFDDYAGEDGLTYLTGWVDKNRNYTSHWAVNPVDEEDAFNSLIDTLISTTGWDHTRSYVITPLLEEPERTTAYYIDCPIEYNGPHVYCYTYAEKTRLKKLSDKYGHVEFVNFLIEAKVLVDLHAILKETALLGLPGYGLKEVERYMNMKNGFKRQLDLPTARLHRNMLELYLDRGHTDIESLEKPGVDNQSAERSKEIVEKYNMDDCLSLISLHYILEEAYQQRKDSFSLSRPKWAIRKMNEAYEDPKQNPEKKELMRVYDELIQKYNDSLKEDGLDEETIDIRKLIISCLQFFSNEEKAERLEYFLLSIADPIDLLDKSDVLVSPMSINIADDKSSIEITFQDQECDFAGKKFYAKTNDHIIRGELSETQKNGDVITATFALEKPEMYDPFMSEDIPQVFVESDTYIKKTNKIELLKDILVEFAEIEIDDVQKSPQFHFIKQLLYRKETLLSTEYQNEKEQLNPSTPSDILNLKAQHLESSIIAVQGPGGTGKSYCIKKLVVDLIKKNRNVKIGITANNHAILNQIGNSIFHELIQQEISATIIQKKTKGSIEKKSEPLSNGLTVQYERKNYAAKKDSLTEITIGTTYFFADKSKTSWFDYLIIEEAGQVTLVDTLLVSASVKKQNQGQFGGLILVGDHKQLLSPIKSTQHNGAEVSGLEYYVNSDIVPDVKGVFINQTRRMHTTICEFDSEMFYESKLTAIPQMLARKITSNHDEAVFTDTQLIHVPVEHNGCTTKSHEEVDAIEKILLELFAPDKQYKYEHEGGSKELEMTDIIIIAPFNNHKDLIKERLQEMESRLMLGKEHDGIPVADLIKSLPLEISELKASVVKKLIEIQKQQDKINGLKQQKAIESNQNILADLNLEKGIMESKIQEKIELFDRLYNANKNYMFSMIIPGSVDKYQGAENAICIYSTACSDLESSPRGPEFIFSRNRFNVAVGRSKALFIMVGSEKLLKPRCKHPKHIELANPFCHFGRIAIKKFIR